jgi:predicted nucleic acid-binding protein
MSGNRYFLDTKAIVQLLAGNPDVIDILSGASYIAISVICELEFLSFPELTENDRRLFEAFAKRVEVIDLCSSDSGLKDRVLAFRSERRLAYKLT